MDWHIDPPYQVFPVHVCEFLSFASLVVQGVKFIPDVVIGVSSFPALEVGNRAFVFELYVEGSHPLWAPSQDSGFVQCVTAAVGVGVGVEDLHQAAGLFHVEVNPTVDNVNLVVPFLAEVLPFFVRVHVHGESVHFYGVGDFSAEQGVQGVDCTLAVLLSFVVEVAIHKVSASCSLALVGASSSS